MQFLLLLAVLLLLLADADVMKWDTSWTKVFLFFFLRLVLSNNRYELIHTHTHTASSGAGTDTLSIVPPNIPNVNLCTNIMITHCISVAKHGLRYNAVIENQIWIYFLWFAFWGTSVVGRRLLMITSSRNIYIVTCFKLYICIYANRHHHICIINVFRYTLQKTRCGSKDLSKNVSNAHKHTSTHTQATRLWAQIIWISIAETNSTNIIPTKGTVLYNTHEARVFACCNAHSLKSHTANMAWWYVGKPSYCTNLWNGTEPAGLLHNIQSYSPIFFYCFLFVGFFSLVFCLLQSFPNERVYIPHSDTIAATLCLVWFVFRRSACVCVCLSNYHHLATIVAIAAAVRGVQAGKTLLFITY